MYPGVRELLDLTQLYIDRILVRTRINLDSGRLVLYDTVLLNYV